MYYLCRKPNALFKSDLIDIALEASSLHHHAPNNLPDGVLTYIQTNGCAVHSVVVYPRKMHFILEQQIDNSIQQSCL